MKVVQSEGLVRLEGVNCGKNLRSRDTLKQGVIDIQGGGVKERASEIRGVKICEMRKDGILDVSKEVGPIPHVVLEALDFVMVSSTNGG